MEDIDVVSSHGQRIPASQHGQRRIHSALPMSEHIVLVAKIGRIVVHDSESTNKRMVDKELIGLIDALTPHYSLFRESVLNTYWHSE